MDRASQGIPCQDALWIRAAGLCSMQFSDLTGGSYGLYYLPVAPASILRHPSQIHAKMTMQTIDFAI